MTETNDSARARHLAWAKAKLESDWGKAKLRENLESTFLHTMRSNVGDVLDLAAITRLSDVLAGDPFVSETVRPLVRFSVMLELARLREDPTPVGTYVSSEARALVDQLLERPNLLPAAFVEKMLTHRAFEEISRDVLDQALRDFSEKVDPFRAEWGLPSLLKKGGPLAFGLGAFAKGFESIREEFDKRLEPERKRFLQVFARKSLEMVAGFIIKRNDQPQFIALRKELFAWLLEQPMSEVVAPASKETVELTENIGQAIAKHVGAMEATRKRRHATIEMIHRAHQKQTLEAALATYGAKLTPDFDALTEVIWPLVKNALKTPSVESFFDELIGGFYDP